jgi:hypothetical protein
MSLSNPRAKGLPPPLFRNGDISRLNGLFQRVMPLERIQLRRFMNERQSFIKLPLCHEDVWESGGIAPPFLTSVLGGGEWSASLSGYFISGERAMSTHWIRDWVDPQSRSLRRGENF